MATVLTLDDLLWTGTEGQDIVCLKNEYCLRVGLIGTMTYWNLYFNDESIKKGRSKSFSFAKHNCIEAFNQHRYGRE